MQFHAGADKYDAAHFILEETQAQRRRTAGPDHPLTASVTNRIGLNHSRRQDFAQARAAFENVLGSEDQGEAVWRTVKHMARMNLAVLQLDEGDVAQALPALQGHLEHYRAAPDSAHNSMTEAALSLHVGRALLLDGQLQRALPLLQRNAGILAEIYPKNPALAQGRSWLGLCCLALGDAPQARALADLARAALHAQSSAGIHYRRSLALLTERLAADPAPR